MSDLKALQKAVNSTSNVDDAEVQKFDEMAAQWWDKEGPCKPLHELNPLRLTFIKNHCNLVNQHILDIGCGGGILTEALSDHSSEVWGIDQAPHSLQIAREHGKSLPTPPRYEQVTAEDFAKKHPGHFDVITCMELLEHVPDPLSVIRAAATLLKPGGHIFFSTLNRTPKSFLYAIVGAEYVLKLLPKGTHDYGHFIRPSELAAWARPHGLQLQHLQGIGYGVFNKRYFLTQDVSVNYLVHFQKELV